MGRREHCVSKITAEIVFLVLFIFIYFICYICDLKNVSISYYIFLACLCFVLFVVSRNILRFNLLLK